MDLAEIWGYIANITLADFFSYISLGLAVAIVYMKDIKKILLGEIAINITVALSFFLTDQLAATGMNIVAVVYVVVAYLYTRKDEKMPLWLLLSFGAVFVGWGAISFKAWSDFFPIICSMLFILAVMQKKPSRYRVFTVSKSLLYTIYDIIISLYSMVPTHAFLFVMGIAAIIQLDILPKRKKIKE